jgi:hypothetical protein
MGRRARAEGGVGLPAATGHEGRHAFGRVAVLRRLTIAHDILFLLTAGRPARSAQRQEEMIVGDSLQVKNKS